MAGGEGSAKKSDLGVRVVSAIVMVAIAGTALWLGGWIWTAFVGLVALGVLWEWWGLSQRLAATTLSRIAWLLGGIGYLGVGLYTLQVLRDSDEGAWTVGALVATVVGVDVGAYFAGRTIGGPKIAPSISPNKTWAGLAGGIVGAAIVLLLSNSLSPTRAGPVHLEVWVIGFVLFFAAPIALIAQIGDFFESWMKRRAGVKDSGTLIPGHGGLLDRLDGLLAFSFVLGLLLLAFA